MDNRIRDNDGSEIAFVSRICMVLKSSLSTSTLLDLDLDRALLEARRELI